MDRLKFIHVNKKDVVNADQSENVGGIAGKCLTRTKFMSVNLINSGDVNGQSFVGGIFGHVKSEQSNSYISDSSSTGNVTGTSDYGEIAGKLENVEIK